MEETPDPLEVARVLKSDLDMLQKIADYAVADTAALGELLGLERPVEMAPREFFHTVCLPKIAALLRTQSYVDQAESDIRTAAARFGNKTEEFSAGGQVIRGMKVGQKDPALKAHLLGLSRAERREFEKRHRRG